MKNTPIGQGLAAIAAATVMLAAAPVGAQEPITSVPQAAAEGSRLWFVELAGAPAVDGRASSALQSEKAAFRKAAAAAGVRYSERRSFNTLFNGFSVDVSPAHRAKLAMLPGVKAMYPVFNVAAPRPEAAAGNAPQLVSAIEMTGAKVAQTTLGLSGLGVKVGIIDTGIDIDHPAFGGSGSNGTTAFPTARVVTGYDFVGDAYDAAGTGNALIPVPDANPDDCAGHGTHVAGIVGANGGGIVGVAPKVSLGAYRVFGCVGSADSDIIVEAMERAYADGMQVVNMSLGSGRQWPQYPTSQAADRLVARGVVVVASAGNNGPGGSSPDALFATGAPGVGKDVISVASYDNAQLSFTVNGTPYGFNTASSGPVAPTSGSLTMARTGTTASADDGCTALLAGSLTGKAALIRRGTCTFWQKAANAQAAGASAVVLYNNVAGALNPSVSGTPAITIPVVAVTDTQGAALDAAIAAGTTTLTWTASYVSWPYGTGGLSSGFSSFGLAADLSLKPNVGAPGGGIYSSYPLELGGTASLSGTSMAAPHVAGGVALILEADPTIPANGMAARLQNSADPKAWAGGPSLGYLDHVHKQGAGMLDIVGTVQSKTVVKPSQLSLGESTVGSHTRTITVANQSDAPVTYAITHVAGLATGPNTQSGTSYALTGIYDGPASVSFSTSTLTVPAHKGAKFDVTITANASLPERSIYGGYIVLTPSDGGATYSVPFAGFKGDYQSTQVLVPTRYGFPWLAQLVGTSYNNRSTGGTFTMVDTDIPYFLIHLDHLSRRVLLEAFDADTGAAMNKVSVDQYVTRASTPEGFFAWAWDGTTFRAQGQVPELWATVPNGRYVVKVSVAKALGQLGNAADTETWTSPVITIARP